MIGHKISPQGELLVPPPLRRDDKYGGGSRGIKVRNIQEYTTKSSLIHNFLPEPGGGGGWQQWPQGNITKHSD